MSSDHFSTSSSILPKRMELDSDDGSVVGRPRSQIVMDQWWAGLGLRQGCLAIYTSSFLFKPHGRTKRRTSLFVAILNKSSFSAFRYCFPV